MGADIGVLFDIGVVVVVVSDTGLNISTGTDSSSISGLLIEIGTAISCEGDSEEGIGRYNDHGGSGWELSNEFDEGNGRDTGVPMGMEGNDK